MQTDRSAKMSLKMSDKIPIKELHIGTTAQIPDATMSSLDSEGAFLDSTDERFIEQLKACGLYYQYVRLNRPSKTEIKGLTQMKNMKSIKCNMLIH